MAERRSISKKIRFEVFKRDKFTCQYCGKSAPEVILQIDHIKPVSKGGDNDILNLVTACESCNNGKSNIELSDDTAIKKQRKQLEELAERKEQLEMMLEWRDSLEELDECYVDAVSDIFKKKTDWIPSNSSRKKIAKWIKEFELNNVLDATDIAIDTYYKGTEQSWSTAFNKISGICYMRKKQADNPQYYYVNYVIKSMKTKEWYCDIEKVRLFIINNVFSEDDFEKVKHCLKVSRNWTTFKENMEYSFSGKFIDRRFD